jgi:2',3'-cyclic-nucleotide 2'-phosphodiesterase (5'-nucleotidase family)
VSPRLLHYSDVENAYDDPGRIGRLARVLREYRDPGTLVCGTGDVVAPGFLSMETDGDHAMAFFEAVSPDVATFGNHDFDVGTDALREVVATSPQTWVTANLREAATDRPFGADAGVDETAVREVDGERVGLFGVTNPPSVREHALAEGVAVRDPFEAAREAVADLREEGVDHVVALSHLGNVDEELARDLEVDAVLGGHTHAQRATVEDGVALTRPGARGRRVAAVDLGDPDPDPELVAVPESIPDRAVVERYREAFESAGPSETVETLPDAIGRRPADTFPESRVGNVVVDAYRWVADADVAVCNAKMLRPGPPLSGEVTLGDLRSTTPFENEIWSTELSGRELRTLFENIGNPAPVDTDVPELFAHVSGARLRWRRDAGGIELAGVEVAGDTLDAGRTYTVAAPTFAFFNDIFAPLDSDRDHEVHAGQHEALAEYVRSEGLPDARDGRMKPEDPDRWTDARSL